jgi:3-hydroxyisobutyrate dehydrogenase-like beta-hydroxyacid dehydrogenase
MNDMTAISVVGLGEMGTALADAYLKAGHPTTVWNRSPAKAEALVARGATAAPTAADAIAKSDLVILCVLDYDAADEVLATAETELDGKVIVNLTNGTPAQARRTAEWVTQHGGRYLDGGIMAIPPMIGGSEAFVLYSGPRVTFDAVRNDLTVLGNAAYQGSDPGLASLHDLALLSAMYGMFAGASHAMAMAGSDDAGFRSLLAGWLRAMADTVADTAEDTNLDMQAIALRNIIEASRAEGIPVDLMTQVQALLFGKEAS